MRLSTGFVRTNGIRLHVAQQGAGDPVVFCHGFPHTWYIWHRQMAAVAAAGYRAIAPDMRGYGRSDAPEDPAAYTNVEAGADLLGLLDEIGAERAVFVGLDFGAALLWELARRAPERIRALIVLNNPYAPRTTRKPSELWAMAARRHFLHLDYFQRPGPADAELADRPRDFLARLYYALSADYDYFDIWRFPPEGNGYLDVLPTAPPLPWPWLAKTEFDTLAAEFVRTGFTGGLNWYRAIDRNWESSAGLPATVATPTFFLYGARDLDMAGFSGRDPLTTLRTHVTDLRAVTRIARAGHLVQLERTDQVNGLLLAHLGALTRTERSAATARRATP
ncbi:alpha/beta hydrolase [Nocardia panacis]|uniref:Alpha/beta hydrolase n=1 Tax=Nocardia panacis TaxID=2340916 RepID=A0A3A4JYL2_9NOCA|nr:alpha/beta hydrolase [Nocardia panacis]